MPVSYGSPAPAKSRISYGDAPPQPAAPAAATAPPPTESAFGGLLRGLKDQGSAWVDRTVGAIDNVLPAISAVPAEVAASGARLLGLSPETVEKTRSSIQMQPFTQTGKDVQNSILGGVNRAVSPWVEAGGKALDATGIPNLRSDVGRLVQTTSDFANVIPAAAIAGHAAQGAFPRAANATEQAVASRAVTPVEQARAAGLEIPASQIEAQGGKPTFGERAREALGGAPNVRRDSVVNNRPVINDIAGGDIGIPAGTQLDAKAFTQAKAPHVAVYNEMRQLPAAPVDSEFRQAVQRSGNNSVVLPTNSEVNTLKAHLISQPTMDGNQLVDTISRLRERALADSKSTAGGDALDLADAQMALADSLEDYLQRRADTVDTSLGQRYKEARRGFAKVHAVESAMDGYHVDPQKLARMDQKHPGRLDGGLALIAQQGRHFPQTLVSQVPMESGGNTFGGMAARGTGALVGGSVGGVPGALTGMLAMEAAPLAARKLLGRAGAPNLAPDGPLASFFPDRAPVTGAPVDPFASDLTLAPGAPQAAAPIPGQISFADVLAEPPPEWAVRPGRPGVDAPPVPTEATVPPSFASLPGSPLQSARQASVADQLAGDLSLAPEPAVTGYVPNAQDLMDWERPQSVGTLPQRPAPPTAGDLQLEGGPSFEDLLRAISDQDSMPVPSSNASFADQLGPTQNPLAVPPGRRQGLDPAMEPTSGLALPPQMTSDFSALLEELGVAPPRAAPVVNADYAPARGFEDLTRFMDEPAPPPGFADLALADDAAPPRSRVDVTEALPSQGTDRFPDRYKRPEANRVESDDGYISYVEKGKNWRIDDAFVREGSRGKGAGQKQLLALAQDAQAAGKALTSDVKVSADQRRVYEKLKAAGKLDFDAGPEGGPVFVNIRPVE